MASSVDPDQVLQSVTSGPKVIKLFSCSTQLSMKFSLLINMKMPTILTLQVWLCGGRLVHVPCSRIGHIARPQPYSFPKGREATELRNYKRAVEVWMGDYKKYVYRAIPAIQVGIEMLTMSLNKMLFFS